MQAVRNRALFRATPGFAYVMCGTEMEYAAPALSSNAHRAHESGSSGTGVAYGGGTEIAYGGTERSHGGTEFSSGGGSALSYGSTVPLYGGGTGLSYGSTELGYGGSHRGVQHQGRAHRRSYPIGLRAC
eukprot:2194125-Rhodomonas_salina.3